MNIGETSITLAEIQRILSDARTALRNAEKTLRSAGDHREASIKQAEKYVTDAIVLIHKLVVDPNPPAWLREDNTKPEPQRISEITIKLAP